MRHNYNLLAKFIILARVLAGALSDNVSVSSIVTDAFFSGIVNQSAASCVGRGFYSRSAFLEAIGFYPRFGRTGTEDDSRREIAAFFAHSAELTGSFCFIEDKDGPNNCDDKNTTYPCAPNKSYYGRGPLQLAWNYNYGPAGNSNDFDGLNNPEIVATNAVISFRAALWFWMTYVHSIMTSGQGFGATFNPIYGQLECNNGSNSGAATRSVDYYTRFCRQLANGTAIDGPHSLTPPPQRKRRIKWSLKFGVGLGGGIAALSILSYLVFRRWRKTGLTDKKLRDLFLPSDIRLFSLAEIKSGTNNFDDNLVLGVGGFGKVYKGCIDNNATIVAIKRLNAMSHQGILEFETEIKMLSKLRHLHLVSLIGYCNDNGEMVLVYDYMANGTLRSHICKPNNPLSWKHRLQICIGSARGLQYLHTSSKHIIIHRDVKSTNILLDKRWVAKVSDFGLSKMGPAGESYTHVSTVVKGTFGYLDPEYFRLRRLTDKSDVYSFGVVLFEVLSGKPAIIEDIPEEPVNLADWARCCYKKGALDEIIDLHVRDEITPECLKKFANVAYSCIEEQGINRPSMNDVVWSLELALQLQEDAENMSTYGDALENMENLSRSIELAGSSRNIPEEPVNLAEWARCCYKTGALDEIIDLHVLGKIALECLKKFPDIAYSCVQEQGINRPSMNEVVWSLELALQLQEAAENMSANGAAL
ncbi:hypothetical protein LguiB_009042 [Lonicera macranthoides]